jgi:glycosyltransferase involved in cell wall biosynthesis
VSAPGPLLTVVVTARDRAAEVRSLLGSLCRQALSREWWELVLVDDGSADGLAEVAREFASSLPLVYSRQRPAGRMSARLHGLYRARGEAILQLEPDDVAPPGLLGAHHAFHQAHGERNAGLVGPLLPAEALGSDRAALALWRADPLLSRAARLRGSGPVDLRRCWRARWSCKRAFVVELHGSLQGRVTGGHDLELAVRLRDEGLRLQFSPAAACWSGERINLAAARRRASSLGEAAARLAAARPRWRMRPWLGVPPGWRVLAPLAGLGTQPRAALRASLLAGLELAGRGTGTVASMMPP